jgi:hypothetical protein
MSELRDISHMLGCEMPRNVATLCRSNTFCGGRLPAVAAALEFLGGTHRTNEH